MRRERPTSRDDLVRAFARLDRNGDGYITADELMRVVTKVCVCLCVCVSLCVHVCGLVFESVGCKRRWGSAQWHHVRTYAVPVVLVLF